MKVDINLLPKKEKKPYPKFIRLLVMSVLTTLLLLVGFYYGYTTYSEIERVENRLDQATQSIAVLESRMAGGEDVQRVRQLENIISQLELSAIPFAYSLNEVIELLPEDAVIEGLQVSNNQIDLSIRTSLNEEPINYYTALQSSESTAEVTIHAISLLENQDYVASYTILLQTEKGDESNE